MENDGESQDKAREPKKVPVRCPIPTLSSSSLTGCLQNLRESEPAADKSNVILDALHGGVGGFLKVSLVYGIGNACISCILEDGSSTINP